MDIPSEQQLYVSYLCNLNADLKSTNIIKEWKVDGEDKLTRQPNTYLDVAKAACLCLEETTDVRAADHIRGETFMMIDAKSGSAGAASNQRKGQNDSGNNSCPMFVLQCNRESSR